MKYIIEGQHTLNGEILISGNKNELFPAIAAALLTTEQVTLKNVPNINDTKVLINLLEAIGVEVSYSSNELKIKAKKLISDLPEELMVKVRGAVVLVGAILSRLGKVKFHHPGGDVIGRRSIDVHLEVFKALGAKVNREDLNYQLNLKKATARCDIFLSERSVTASENAILASVLGSSNVILRNCATEPHVVGLCRMLQAMGAKITGIGSDTLHITGVSKLNGATHTLGIDFIEVGTYAIAAAITGGKINIKGEFKKEDLDPILLVFQRFGISINYKSDQITFSANKLVGIDKIVTNVWPGFPTDMMSCVIVLATQSNGLTLCHDWMYESRMFFVDKLISMGANITLADPHRVIVSGPSKLKSRELETPDIRAGMALVLAALVAHGKSVINRAELIERGYEDVVGKLGKIGAVIERVE